MDPEERLQRERAKVMMRTHARSFRASVPVSALEVRSERIRERLAALPVVAAAATIGLFWPIVRNNEVDLRPLVALWQAVGKRLAFPRVQGEGAPLAFAWVEDSATLEERGRGFSEPPAHAPEATALEVIVVPALLLDGRGHRLGYGAGYYDRTLRRFCPPGIAVAVAFDFQLAAEIPDLEDDVPVDRIVTDARTLERQLT